MLEVIPSMQWPQPFLGLQAGVNCETLNRYRPAYLPAELVLKPHLARQSGPRLGFGVLATTAWIWAITFALMPSVACTTVQVKAHSRGRGLQSRVHGL